MKKNIVAIMLIAILMFILIGYKVYENKNTNVVMSKWSGEDYSKKSKELHNHEMLQKKKEIALVKMREAREATGARIQKDEIQEREKIKKERKQRKIIEEQRLEMERIERERVEREKAEMERIEKERIQMEKQRLAEEEKKKKLAKQRNLYSKNNQLNEFIHSIHKKLNEEVCYNRTPTNEQYIAYIKLADKVDAKRKDIKYESLNRDFENLADYLRGGGQNENREMIVKAHRFAHDLDYHYFHQLDYQFWNITNTAKKFTYSD